MPKKTKYEFVHNGEKAVFEQETPKTEKSEKAPSKQVVEKNSNQHKEDRERKFSLVCYIKDINEIRSFLKRSEWIQHYAYATHDRDFEEDGVTPKVLHTHILIYTYNAHTLSAIRKRFKSLALFVDAENPQNTLGQICYDMVHMWRYLLHKDDPQKAQYEECERFCDDFSYWHKYEVSSGMNDSSDNRGLAMLKDYMNGVHPLEMAHRYGKEYIYHLSHFQKYAYEVFKADARNNVNTLNIRDMMHLCLESSPLADKDIKTFWVVYDFIITQINQNYNSKIDFYLTENTNA